MLELLVISQYAWIANFSQVKRIFWAIQFYVLELLLTIWEEKRENVTYIVYFQIKIQLKLHQFKTNQINYFSYTLNIAVSGHFYWPMIFLDQTMD